MSLIDAKRVLSRALAGLLISTAGALPAWAQQGGASAYWVGSWGTAPQPAIAQAETTLGRFNNQTLRQIVHTSLGGQRLRVRLSNAFGTVPLVVGEARVALQAAGAATDPATDRVLTFNGQAGITLPAGATAVSDPVSLSFNSGQNLAVSIYLPVFTAATTQHLRARQTSYVSTPGNFTGAAAQPGVFSSLCTEGFNPKTCTSSWYFLTNVDVETATPLPAVVALGDSITNGAYSSANLNRRWTDALARRLRADGQTLGVLNQGIGGNTLVAWGQGGSMVKRFERDVAGQAGAKFAIVLGGINDIKKGFTADKLITGYQSLISQARQRHIRIYGATLTPNGRGTDAQEAQRQAVNAWIRNSGAFDAVVDFDAALRDPAAPCRLLPLYDGGDSLHPNDAGYEAMGQAVNLALFRP